MHVQIRMVAVPTYAWQPHLVDLVSVQICMTPQDLAYMVSFRSNAYCSLATQRDILNQDFNRHHCCIARPTGKSCLCLSPVALRMTKMQGHSESSRVIKDGSAIPVCTMYFHRNDSHCCLAMEDVTHLFKAK